MPDTQDMMPHGVKPFLPPHHRRAAERAAQMLASGEIHDALSRSGIAAVQAAKTIPMKSEATSTSHTEPPTSVTPTGDVPRQAPTSVSPKIKVATAVDSEARKNVKIAGDASTSVTDPRTCDAQALPQTMGRVEISEEDFEVVEKEDLLEEGSTIGEGWVQVHTSR